MAKYWTYFTCDTETARTWHLAIEELGGVVERGGKPECPTDDWNDDDWTTWEYGGDISLDENTFGAVGFYRKSESRVLASYFGSNTILRLFKAMGAEQFSEPSIVGDSASSRFVVLDKILSTAALRNRFSIKYDTLWPGNVGRYGKMFCHGVLRQDGIRIFFETGLAYRFQANQFYFYCVTNQPILTYITGQPHFDAFIDAVLDVAENQNG